VSIYLWYEYPIRRIILAINASTEAAARMLEVAAKVLREGAQMLPLDVVARPLAETPNRVKILESLRGEGRPYYASKLSAEVGIHQQQIGETLRDLASAGLVVSEERIIYVNCGVSADGMAQRRLTHYWHVLDYQKEGKTSEDAAVKVGNATGSDNSAELAQRWKQAAKAGTLHVKDSNTKPRVRPRKSDSR
jgi:DNA-binding transcriptional ArsR family regulator